MRRGAARGLARGAVGGMTLIELLFVMALLAVLFGMGLGALGSLDVGERAARTTLETTLRAANNWAVARNAPATVRIDRAARTLHAEGTSLVGTWRFESLPVEGAFDLVGEVHGRANLDPDGFRGSALSLVGVPSGTGVRIPVQTDSAWDLGRGFDLAVVVRRARSGGRVLDVGGAVDLDVTPSGAVRASFGTVEIEEDGEERPTGRATLVTEDGLVPEGRWTRLEISYDREVFVIRVNGIDVERLAQDGMVASLQGPLVVGGTGSPFPGAIDDLVVSAVATEETFALPDGVDLAEDVPARVRFRAGGGLDRRLHREPVTITLVFEDGRTDALRVNLYGTVE